MAEKRQKRRSPIELAASYGIGEDLRPGREAKISNMSSGGFCFTSDDNLKVGEKIQLAVDLETAEDVLITVKVVWVKKSGHNEKYTIGVQIDAQSRVAEDRVADDRVAGPRIAIDRYPVQRVVGNDVSFAGAGTADCVVGDSRGKNDTVLPIRLRSDSIGTHSDQVALNRVVVGSGVAQEDP